MHLIYLSSKTTGLTSKKELAWMDERIAHLIEQLIREFSSDEPHESVITNSDQHTHDILEEADKLDKSSGSFSSAPRLELYIANWHQKYPVKTQLNRMLSFVSDQVLARICNFFITFVIDAVK